MSNCSIEDAVKLRSMQVVGINSYISQVTVKVNFFTSQALP